MLTDLLVSHLAPKEILLLFFRAGNFGATFRMEVVLCAVERGGMVCAIAALAPNSIYGVRRVLLWS